MSEPKKVDRRKFIYAGLGAVALIAIGAAAYVAMNPPVVTQTVTTSTTVPTTSVVTTTVTGTPTTSPTTTQPYAKEIPYWQKSRAVLFWYTCEIAAVKAAEALGYKTTSTDAEGDPIKMNDQMDALLARKPLAIVGNPIDGEAQAMAVRKAHRSGVPVGIVDTPISGYPAAVTVVYNNYEGGKTAAQTLIKLLEEKYGSTKGLKVAQFYGYLGSPAWRDRMEGFDAVMKEHPEIQHFKLPTEGTVEGISESCSAFLAQHPDVHGMHFMSQGPWLAEVLRQLEAKGLLYYRTHPKHIIITGIDGDPFAVYATKRGWIDATISQDPIAYSEICVDVLHTEIIPKLPKVELLPVGYVYKKTEKYYWGKGALGLEMKAVDTPGGPTLYQPHYVIDYKNVDSPLHWGIKIVKDFKVWDSLLERKFKAIGAPEPEEPWEPLFGLEPGTPLPPPGYKIF